MNSAMNNTAAAERATPKAIVAACNTSDIKAPKAGGPAIARKTRIELEAAIEALITLLDVVDGDPDFEVDADFEAINEDGDPGFDDSGLVPQGGGYHV
jgi:hypothetical protein